MAPVDLYNYCDFSASPQVFFSKLTAAIARGYQVPWVGLSATLPGSASYWSHWPKTQPVPTALRDDAPQGVQLHRPVQETRYEAIGKKYNLQAIAVLTVTEIQQGQLWLGFNQEVFPSEETLAGWEALRQTFALILARRSSQAHASRCYGYLGAFRSMHQLMDTTENMGQLFQMISNLIVDHFEVTSCSINLLKSAHPLKPWQEQLSSAKMEHQTTADNWPDQWFVRDCDLCQAAWAQAPGVWMVGDLTTKDWRSPLQQNGYRSFLFAPLVASRHQVRQTLQGFMILAMNQPRRWLAQEMDVLGLMGDQLSRTIIYRRTLNRVQTHVNDRTRKLTLSLDIQAKLRETLRHQIEQLRHLNELKDDFLSTVSHELNTPLATMKLAVKMLRQPERSQARRDIYLDILDHEINRESRLISNLLQIQQAEANHFALKPSTFLLGPTLTELAQEYSSSWEALKHLQVNLTFKPESTRSTLQLETDQEHFKNAISELLTNAGKYAAPWSAVEMGVEHLGRSPASVRITISNYGAAIEPEEQPHIFDKFRRGSRATSQAIPGTGLGLALVKTIITQLQGSITVSSEPSSGRDDHYTVFTIDLPQQII